MKRRILALWNLYAVRWTVLFLFYFSIIMILSYMYGFVNLNPSSKFIYNGF
ncbi:teichoic acid D-Ala incorporation-associated protein DltX [Ectobacillus polymachus]|uniref:teichoic acid D-Ala incorporation-associated protein DltX n=1 Tax=Ectobacillus polymachus TaxID=1508806 RepID=UPI003A8C6C0F